MTIEIRLQSPKKCRQSALARTRARLLSLTEHDTPRPDKNEIPLKSARPVSIEAIVISAWALSATARASEIRTGICRNGRSLRIGRHALAARRTHCRFGGRRWLRRIRVVHEDHALEIPENMSFSDAAALPETIYTVWANVFELGGLVADETLLIMVAPAALAQPQFKWQNISAQEWPPPPEQMKNALFVKNLGLTSPLITKTPILKPPLPNLPTAKAPISFWIWWAAAIFSAILQPRTRRAHCQYAHLEGARAEIDMLPVMLKNLTLTGSTLRARPIPENQTDRHYQGKNLAAHWQGVKPDCRLHVSAGQAGAAQSLMETSQHIGKIILDCEV